MAIRYYTEDIKLPSLHKRETNEWIRAVAAHYDKVCGEISYIFCSDKKILAVNKTYLQHDYYTDVITFDYTEGNDISGDIFISLDTVQSNAALFGSTFGEELYRVLIHGVLHLCGIDDKASGEREAMTVKENEALALLPEKLRISVRQLRGK
ncbi:MAG: rRNA maturation RNase YbeY [Porphyromonadaceae bacterium]|nr:rRNA maturation RNase YbeY [Porphyromonadaceae bacterium]